MALTAQQYGQMRNALQVQKKYEDRILKTKNVKTVGVGYVEENGKQTGEIGLIVGVEEKISVESLKTADLLPVEIEGVRVDVQKSGIPTAPRDPPLVKEDASNLTGEVHPLTTGYSIGNAAITAGTTGYFAIRNGRVGVTSNAHVFCVDPSLDMSQYIEQQLNTSIVQPGTYDGGKTQRATLKTFVQIQKTGSLNYVDSAWAELLDQNDYTPDVPLIGKNLGLDSGDPALGDHLRKVGRTTGLTSGTVNSINVSATISYGSFSATFRGLVATTSMSQGGDSGSIAFLDNNKMKYRLFAGSNDMTLFFPLKMEVSALSLVPITSDDTPTPPNPDTDVQVDFMMEQDGGGVKLFRLFGNVRQQNGDALPGVTMALSGNGLALTVQTSESGAYEFKGLQQGDYSLTASMSGYKAQTKQVSLIPPSTMALPMKLEVAKRR